MLAFLCENWGTLIVCAVLLAAISGIVAGMIRNKRKGVSACCGDCAHCSCCSHAPKN